MVDPAPASLLFVLLFSPIELSTEIADSFLPFSPLIASQSSTASRSFTDCSCVVGIPSGQGSAVANVKKSNDGLSRQGFSGVCSGPLHHTYSTRPPFTSPS